MIVDRASRTANGMDRRCSPQYPRVERGSAAVRSPAMPRQSTDTVAVLGIDIGKNTFHLVGLNERGAIILRRKLSRVQLEARLANLPPCLVGMEACVGAHHLSRRLEALGHDARLMPARYVRAYLKGNKNDFRDAEAIAEAVQRRPCASLPPRRPSSSICRRCTGCAHAWSASARRSSTRSAPSCSTAASPSPRVSTACVRRCRASWARAPTSFPRASCTSSRT